MADFDRGAISTEPRLGFNTDITVRYKGVFAGVVTKAAAGDYYVCLLGMKSGGQSYLQQCSQSDSTEQAAEVIAHRFWLLNETPEFT